MAGWLNRAGSPPNRMRRRPSDEHRRLDELAAGDLEVRASIALSYRALPDRQQRAFRRLGLLEALDFPAWVAAAVLDLDPARGEDLVDALVDAQLLETGGIDQVGQVRYRFYDLLRVYARERALSDDDPAERTAALMRGFGGWLLLAGQAATVVKAGTLGLAHGGALRWPPGPAISGLVDAEPLAWFEAERTSLVAAVHQAAGGGLDELAWDLAGCLARFFAVLRCLAVDRALGDRLGEALTLQSLGELQRQ